jgi:hypothetical protein
VAVTLEQAVQDNAVAGDHIYDAPPLAVSVVDEPRQIATLELPLIEGSEFTVTVTDAVLLQPFEFVPITE